MLIFLLTAFLVVSCYPGRYVTFSFFSIDGTDDITVSLNVFGIPHKVTEKVKALFGAEAEVRWYTYDGVEYTENSPITQEITVYPRSASDSYLKTDDSISQAYYIIHSEEGLTAWREASDVLTSNVILVDNITLDSSGEENNWTPIGTSSDDAYTGTFSGNGFAITGMKISSISYYVGMFGYIGSDGKVKDLGLTGADITGVRENSVFSSSAYIGIIAGKSDGSITACYSTGKVTGSGSGRMAGGIAGNNGGTIIACYSTADAISQSGTGGRSGGIVAYNDGGTVTACYSTGDISTNCYYGAAGGIIGGSNGGSVNSCYYSGKIESTGGNGRVVTSGTKIDGASISWIEGENSAMTKMNAVLTDYEYYPNEDDQDEKWPLLLRALI